MSMKVSNPNDVKIYTIASPSITALPEWLSRSRRKQLRHDPNFSHRVELLQDFEFPEASIRLRQTRDSKYIVATGVYKPQFRVFELAQMSMKFDRHTDCENVQFEILSEDWKKMVLLQADRSVEFHTPQGLYHRTRIPKFGRDMAYHPGSCDLLIGASGNQVYRLNLEHGQFLNPLDTDSPAINCTSISAAHGLWGFGGEDGHVEFWDHRTRDRIGRLNVGAQITTGSAFSAFPEITALNFHRDGLLYAAGTKSGQVLMFDMRSTKPVFIKDHQYDLPIKKITFLENNSDQVLTVDSKIIKIWDKNTGRPYTSIEPEDDINDCIVDSGLLMTANESPRMNIFFIPSLGPAPKWCSFLDNLTEELEEDNLTSGTTTGPNVWDDYKFVSRPELTQLGLDHLVGTSVLKAYMHGFFIDLRLYEKARAIANPFAYDDYKKRIAKDKIEQERQSRISATSKLPKINRALAARLMSKKGRPEGEEGTSETVEENKSSAPAAKNPLGDSRFADMFMDPDFQVEEDNPEYIKYHPSEAAAYKQKMQSRLDDGDFERVSDDEESDEEPEGRASDDEDIGDVYGSNDQRMSDDDDELLSERIYKKKQRNTKSTEPASRQKQPKVKFYEVGDAHTTWDKLIAGKSSQQHQQHRRQRQQPFADRLKMSSEHMSKTTTNRQGGPLSARPSHGAMTMTYRTVSAPRGRGGRRGGRGGAGSRGGSRK